MNEKIAIENAIESIKKSCCELWPLGSKLRERFEYDNTITLSKEDFTLNTMIASTLVILENALESLQTAYVFVDNVKGNRD
mgnify:FL=1